MREVQGLEWSQCCSALAVGQGASDGSHLSLSLLICKKDKRAWLVWLSG